MDEEDEHFPTSFIILRIWKLLIQKLKQVSSENHRRFYQPTENCKHKQEDTDTNTFLFGGGEGGGGVPKVQNTTKATKRQMPREGID